MNGRAAALTPSHHAPPSPQARLTPGLEGQRLLVAYPCMLAYSMFAVLSLY